MKRAKIGQSRFHRKKKGAGNRAVVVRSKGKKAGYVQQQRHDSPVKEGKGSAINVQSKHITQKACSIKNARRRECANDLKSKGAAREIGKRQRKHQETLLHTGSEQRKKKQGANGPPWNAKEDVEGKWSRMLSHTWRKSGRVRH